MSAARLCQHAVMRPTLLLALGLYALVLAGMAWLGRRRTGTLADYTVGGRSLGGVLIGLSFFATYASTNSYLGFSGKAYSHGAPWLLMMPFAVGLSALSWWVVAPRLREVAAHLDALTVPDLLGFRFRSPAARTVSAVVVVLASTLYTMAVFKGAGNLFEELFDLPYPVAIGAVLVIVVCYTATGGFHSVVRTDALQALLMVSAAIVLTKRIAGAAGGLDGLRELSTGADTEFLFTWNARLPIAVLLGVLFASTVKFLAEPRQLSRFFALRDRRAARIGIGVSTACFLVVFSLLLPIGLFAHRLLQPGSVDDTDRVVPMLLSDPTLFGPLALALLFLALLSAALSSLDSVLLVLATTIERDLLAPRRRTEGSDTESGGTIRNVRLLIVGSALLAALLALRPPAGIVELTAFSGALYGACFLAPVLFGLHWHRGDGVAALTAIGVGASALLIGRMVTLPIHEVFPATVLSTLGYVLVALTRPPVAEPEVRQLFQG